MLVNSLFNLCRMAVIFHISYVGMYDVSGFEMFHFLVYNNLHLPCNKMRSLIKIEKARSRY